ncbi:MULTISPECIES: hypothetical protein [unclassified Ensifer]|uniref:hypothetical protein n=1 Tax=unclassified Ensifer TaxID=2633371 RepID=UPI000710B156|nr:MULTISPECIES: hypothetical protein [unclassified Ensifer]KQY69947.1 hypothetical protein ASD52_31370 [Ensifer sp. Root142]
MMQPIGTTVNAVPTRTGKVVIPAELQSDVDQFHYAPARRAGDFVYLSGIVAANGTPNRWTPKDFVANCAVSSR